MIPLLLAAALFLFLTLVGQAVLTLVNPRFGLLRGWLLSPALGLAVVVLFVTRINIWGCPVGDFGPWLTGGLLIISALLVARARRPFPQVALKPFAVLAAALLIYVGWPHLRYGFNWISYGNDDMANYTLAAERFLNFGFSRLPLLTELESSDYSQPYWYMHVLQQIRPGAEITLAWVASITGLKPVQIFMPTILMLTLVQFFALAAAALHRGKDRRLALWACVFLALSPLFSLGTLYQLIAQVGGVALLFACGAAIIRPARPKLRSMGLAALLCAGLAVYYPEVSPFLVLGLLLWLARYVTQPAPALQVRLLYLLGIVAVSFVLLGSTTFQFLNTVTMQAAGKSGLDVTSAANDQTAGMVLFPWTLIPSYLPMIFGLHAFGLIGIGPMISIKIAIACVGFVYICYRAQKDVRAGTPVGLIGAVMVALGFFLFYKNQDFGLFKLGMFAQPFIALCLAHAMLALLVRARLRILGYAAVACYIIGSHPVQTFYSIASLGQRAGSLTEIHRASELGVAFTPPTDIAYQAIESDISNVVAAKLLAQSTRGTDTVFLSRNYTESVANIYATQALKNIKNPDLAFGPSARLSLNFFPFTHLLPSVLRRDDIPDQGEVRINGTDNTWADNTTPQLPQKSRLFVSLRPELDHFNKANPGQGWRAQNMYQYLPSDQVRDRLVFIHSSLSPHYYSPGRYKAAFYQREHDSSTGGKSDFHATGRYNHFLVINPSPQTRLAIAFTASPLGESRPQLPAHAKILGRDEVPVPFVGHGSARIFTPPVTPEIIESRPYLTLDLGLNPPSIKTPRTGLMATYGTDLDIDDRRIVGYTRDISLISEEQYQNLPRPTRLHTFPDDLVLNPALEYSGIAEDGVIAHEAFLKLGPSKLGQSLTLSAELLATDATRTGEIELLVTLNQRTLPPIKLAPGAFTHTFPLVETTAITSLSLQLRSINPAHQTFARKVRCLQLIDVAITDPAAPAASHTTH